MSKLEPPWNLTWILCHLFMNPVLRWTAPHHLYRGNRFSWSVKHTHLSNAANIWCFWEFAGKQLWTLHTFFHHLNEIVIAHCSHVQGQCWKLHWTVPFSSTFATGPQDWSNIQWIQWLGGSYHLERNPPADCAVWGWWARFPLTSKTSFRLPYTITPAMAPGNPGSLLQPCDNHLWGRWYLGSLGSLCHFSRHRQSLGSQAMALAADSPGVGAFGPAWLGFQVETFKNEGSKN